jgi:hypothetical protein
MTTIEIHEAMYITTFFPFLVLFLLRKHAVAPEASSRSAKESGHLTKSAGKLAWQRFVILAASKLHF